MHKHILLFVLVIAALLFLIPVINPPDSHPEKPLRGMPWQISTNAEGHQQIFSMVLGQTTLADAIEKYGPPEGLALFESEQGQTLEAFFGTIKNAGLKAKLIARLQLPAHVAERIQQHAKDQQGTRSGARKWLLSDEEAQKSLSYPISGLTWIPSWKGMDSDYLRQRFGEPAAWKQVNEQIVQWYYPKLGVDIQINSDGPEIFSYWPLETFSIPQDAHYHNKTAP
ncbi:MAG: hypothetical protein KZQ58_06595 [gamma proteobacterium symbiont of Bathyaustriella thionipta]|nr:hypothetical protein [gamma proteobacterium symbiont of Bathyaustriella thionipta]